MEVSSDEAHWPARHSYICFVNRTTAAPQLLRRTVSAASGAGRLVLVGVDQVVVGRFVEENEPETDGEAAHHGASVRDVGIASPSKDNEAERYHPAGEQHRDQAFFGGWPSILVFGADLKVVDVA